MLEAYWPFWWGGIAIAAVAVTVVAVGGHFLSITRGYVSLCSLVTRKPYFHAADIGGGMGFRSMFSIGVVLGGFLAAITGPGWHPSFALGSFDTLWGTSVALKGAVLVSGGIMWGYGSRMARGCTSGNSISGLSQGSLAALVATVMFLVGGAALTRLLEAVLGAR